MTGSEREVLSTRAIEVAIERSYAITDWFSRPAVLLVWLAGVRTEVEFAHGKAAYAAAERIALAHRLWKMPGRARWRSRPK